MLEEESFKVESLIYLGTKFDYDISWGPHIKQLSKKLSRAWGVIRKIEHMVNSLFF